MSSRYRLLETPKGSGKVSLGDQSLAEARYSLTVRQEFVAADDQMIEGHREIDGTLSGRSTWEDLEGTNDDPFTLELADGRRLNFLFIDSRRGRIKGTGGFY